MNEFRPVYSSEQGRLCPGCGQPAKACRCAGQGSAPGDGRVRVQRSGKGRGGKTVSLVTGVPLAGEELKALGKELKRLCGTGGTVKDGVIEVQGDHVDKLVAALQQRGFSAKRSGG